MLGVVMGHVASWSLKAQGDQKGSGIGQFVYCLDVALCNSDFVCWGMVKPMSGSLGFGVSLQSHEPLLTGSFEDVVINVLHECFVDDGNVEAYVVFELVMPVATRPRLVDDDGFFSMVSVA